MFEFWMHIPQRTPHANMSVYDYFLYDLNTSDHSTNSGEFETWICVLQLFNLNDSNRCCSKYAFFIYIYQYMYGCQLYRERRKGGQLSIVFTNIQLNFLSEKRKTIGCFGDKNYGIYDWIYCLFLIGLLLAVIGFEQHLHLWNFIDWHLDERLADLIWDVSTKRNVLHLWLANWFDLICHLLLWICLFTKFGQLSTNQNEETTFTYYSWTHE